MSANQSTPLMSDTTISNMPFLIKDETGRIQYHFRKCAIHLTAQMLTISYLNKNDGSIAKKAIEYPISALIGMKYDPVRTRDQVVMFKATFIFYPIKPDSCWHSNKTGNVRERKTIELYFRTEETTCINWKHAIYSIVHNQLPLIKDENGVDVLAPRTKEFLIFVNPKSGKGTTLTIWKQQVQRMLEEAGVLVEVVITEYANHARDFVHTCDLTRLTNYTAIMMIGGDGIIYEVLNGIATRADPENNQNTGLQLLKRLTFAPIPGGTGNGLVKSILNECSEACTPLNAVFAAIRGIPVPMDLSEVITCDNTVQYSFLALFWGLVADIDLHSEVLRCLGEARLYLGAVYFILQKRRYAGKLTMTLLPHCTYNTSQQQQHNVPVNHLYSHESLDPTTNQVTLTSDFVMITVLQQSHIAMSVQAGPGVQLSDGAFTICVVEARQATRASLAHIMLAMDSGEHVSSASVRVFQCTAYTLEPLDHDKKGIYSLDGEHIPYGKIQATILPSATRVFSLPTTIQQ